MKTLGSAAAILLAALLVLGCARSTFLLRGEAAEDHIGARERLAEPGAYTFLGLANRQTGILMAAIFNPAGEEEHEGNFEIVRREKSMGYRSSDSPFTAVVLNSPGGKPGRKPEPEIFDEIERSRLVTAVVLNAEGGEEAVVFLPAGQRLAAFLRPDGEVRLELGHRMRGEGDIRYSLEFDGALRKTEEWSPRRETKKEREEMREIKVGDLVQWDTGVKVRVGVVKSIDQGGTAVVNVPTTGGSREERIKVERLHLIASTIESE